MTLVAPNPLGTTTQVDVVVPGRLVEIAGRIDSRAAHDIRVVLDEAIGAATGDLVVDVGLAEVYDSTGLGVLVGAAHRASVAGRRLVLAHPSVRVERLLRGARLTRFVHRID